MPHSVLNSGTNYRMPEYQSAGWWKPLKADKKKNVSLMKQQGERAGEIQEDEKTVEEKYKNNSEGEI